MPPKKELKKKKELEQDIGQGAVKAIIPDKARAFESGFRRRGEAEDKKRNKRRR